MFLLHLEISVHDEVGRVTCCGKRTCTSWSFVNRALIAVATLDFWHIHRFEPHVRHLGVQNLRMWFGKDVLFAAPSTAFKEKTVNIGSVLCTSLEIILLGVTHNLEVEVYLIDWDNIFSGIVLLTAGQEALSEEETWNPECLWNTVINPILHEFESLNEVKNPWS